MAWYMYTCIVYTKRAKPITNQFVKKINKQKINNHRRFSDMLLWTNYKSINEPNESILIN